MCLVIDSDKKKGDGRYGFIDLIFGDFSFGDLNLSIMIELNKDEKTLLKRKFIIWLKKENKPNLTTLNNILLSADVQLKKYMNIIAYGKAQDRKPGIIDSRFIIKQQFNDSCILNGYVIMMIGFRCLVSRFVGSQNIYFSLTKKNEFSKDYILVLEYTSMGSIYQNLHAEL
ncbi:hypothetical protein C2G38_2191665 [Gigaspora rosea]|uniref:Uncharacterized protein n=1 Tax=Gigaspora rosea TaxID=44941 RepID=A0A397V4A8_9GLOM|nr:hypothetical protein C2G38_2191665 [Gigaspora rosea]